jgi:hypothetical protein
MPVYRFRGFDEARRALWTSRDDPQLLLRLQRMWKLSARLFPGGMPRGVRKFRDIAEANRDREAWVKQRVLALRATRHRGGSDIPQGE